MKKPYLLLLAVLLALSLPLSAQENLPPDTLCVPYAPGALIANLFADDGITVGEDFLVEAQLSSDCFTVDRETGDLSFTDLDDEMCCGEFRLSASLFRRSPTGALDFIGTQRVLLTVKCPKPDCGLVDLDDLPPGDPTSNPDEPTPPACLSACENSTATYLFAETPGFAYDWQATNGSVDVTPGAPNQISVSWGGLGAANLFVDIYDPAGNLTETRNFCVELTPTPVPDFTFAPVACLGQDVYFVNTSSGPPATFNWNFGDGTGAQDEDNPVHAYDSPGTYEVTLYATSDGGLNPDGSAACCCTDSITYQIEVDPLPGPGIFWVSTLCDGDTSRYWTDATGCDMVNWTVSPNGTPLTPLDQDTITVLWTSGPSGTLTLNVTDCDQAYCPAPAVAVVPVIGDDAPISGPVEVCGGTTAGYQLPKWMTVSYDWSVSGGATISGEGHDVTISWPTTPGDYTIDVTYGSDFLAGLPGHGGDDCFGTATLAVTVLGDFELAAAPDPACTDGFTFFSATSNLPGPATYDWSVVGHPGLDVMNQSSFNVIWSSLPGPGVYIIEATTTDAAAYCVATKSISVVVEEATDPLVDGPTDYCVGDSLVFSVTNPQPGYTYNWTIAAADGSVVAGNGSPNATIELSSLTGATVTVQGFDGAAPFCATEPVGISLTTIGFVGPAAITGLNACTNSTAMYSIDTPQHPATEYEWVVFPPEAGSVVAGAGTAAITVQWNDEDPAAPFPAVGIGLTMRLCGQEALLALPLDLNTPTEPVIVETGSLCPGGSTELSVNGAVFSSVVWDLGGVAGAVSGTDPAVVTVLEPGDIVVNTVDLNGCAGVGRYRVEEVDGPAVSISSPDQRRICVNSSPYPAPPVLTALTDGANTIEWFCGNDSQGPPTVGNTTFTHSWVGVPGSYAYRARVTDPNGCFSLSDPIIVIEEYCCDTPFVIEEPLAELHTFTLTQQTPNCDVVDLFATWSADSADAHGFNWFFDDAVTLSQSTDPLVASDSRTVRLPGVGSYTLFHSIGVWAYDRDTTFMTDAQGNLIIDTITVDSVICSKELSQKVSVPLRADFDFTETCGEVVFSDATEFLGGTPPPGTTYSWAFGDPASSTSTAASPTFDYGANGTYTVSLTVSDGQCESVHTATVTVDDLPAVDFTFAPSPVCFGESIAFIGTGTNVISWEWDFDDGATFVGNNPQHAFLPLGGTGVYNVKLVAESRAGCRDSIIYPVTVFAAPAPDTITASNGLILCDGDVTALSVNTAPGLTYLWTTGETSSSIDVDAAGTYGVTVTTADGCSRAIDPVDVQLVPLPDAGYTGNPFICDFGSTELTAVAGGGHTIVWTNLSTGVTVTGPTYVVPYNGAFPVQSITLTVTSNDFNCTAEAELTVEQAVSPSPIAAITAGDACADSETTISVTNFDPELVYTWSTGASGPSITTFAAGSYTVVATDPVSGCSGSATVTVFPLPDLCVVPTGCYEACAPDTLSGPLAPAGVVYDYDWQLDGVTVGTDQDLIVSTTGSYVLTVTNTTTGCEATSDELILELIDCDPEPPSDCDDVVTRLRSVGQEGACCFELFYDNLPPDVYLIQISSPDADLPVTFGSADPVFGFAANAAPNVIQLAAGNPLTTPVPTSMTTGAVTFCPANFTAVPQTILIEYIAEDGKTVLCEDKLFTDCPVEPDCVYVTEDALDCDEDGNLVFTVTICNPSGADFPVGFVQFIPLSPAGLPAIDQTLTPALLPGDCRTLTFSLPALTPGDSFAYTFVGHSANPGTDPGALCCNDAGEDRKLEVPDCDPCDNIAVADVKGGEDCCYDVSILNDAAGFGIDGVDLCLIGSDATLAVFSAIGDPLVGTVTGTGQTATIGVVGGGELPAGTFALPTFCLEGSEQPEHRIEVKFTSGGEVVCRDTITVFCQPPCGYLVEESIDCEDGAYVWSGEIVNTSAFPMGEAYVEFDAAAGLSAYNQTIVFGAPLPPGASTGISFAVGSPAAPGDTVCFRVVLHENGPDDFHLNCCAFTACIVLPDCQIEECVCPEQELFADEVQAGFDTVGLTAPGLAYRFIPRYAVEACDELIWEVRTLQPNTPYMEIGRDVNQDYVFPGPGRYQVRLTVVRTQDDGKQCRARTTRQLRFQQDDTLRGDLVSTAVELFPNPAEGEVYLRIPAGPAAGRTLRYELLDVHGHRVRSYVSSLTEPGEQQVFRVDISGLKSGVYILRGRDWSRKLVVR